MARYGEAFRNRVVARLLPPESANVGAVAKEIGLSVQTLERWREEARSRPARGRARENINVPAGTFDAFKVEGEGFNRNGNHYNITYWIAPDKVRQPIAMNTINRGRGGKYIANDRIELLDFKQG